MKITKKRLLLPISIVATALVTGGVVYAFSSSSFLTQAQKYVSSQCNSALISSKNTVANNQKATVCYNYYKNIEQDANLASLNSSVTKLQNKKAQEVIFFNGTVTQGTDSSTVDTLGSSVMTIQVNWGSGACNLSVKSSNDQINWNSQQPISYFSNNAYVLPQTIVLNARYYKINVSTCPGQGFATYSQVTGVIY